MKHLLPFALGVASALALVVLPSMTAPAPAAELPGGITVGSVVFGFSVLKGGAGGLAGIDAGTPVTLREANGDWVLIDYPSQTGGPSWVNVNSIVSYQINR